MGLVDGFTYRVIFFLACGFVLTACSGKSLSCPENFIQVPPLGEYSSISFCVAKYEMKKVEPEGQAEEATARASSLAEGTPWANISQQGALEACQALGEGYDLITNDRWQAIARNIESVRQNWKTGVVGIDGEEINRGYFGPSATAAIAAASDDTMACEGTGQECSLREWHKNRRTHVLSNGEVIWDFSGNVSEWIKEIHAADGEYGSSTYVSQIEDIRTERASLGGGPERTAKDQFGPAEDYSTLNDNPWGGLGYAYLISPDESNKGVFRGASYDESSNSGPGIFSVNLLESPSTTADNIGFRCTSGF